MPGQFFSCFNLLSVPLHLPCLDLCLSTPNLLGKKLHAFICPDAIRKMRWQDCQDTIAHSVTGLADDLYLLLREIGDLIVVLPLLRVSIENNARNLILHICRKV